MSINYLTASEKIPHNISRIDLLILLTLLHSLMTLKTIIGNARPREQKNEWINIYREVLATRISISFRLRKCLAPFSDAPGRSLPRTRSPFLRASLGETGLDPPATTSVYNIYVHFLFFSQGARRRSVGVRFCAKRVSSEFHSTFPPSAELSDRAFLI